MRIFIIGYMLSGKSTIGKKLANVLGYEFIDTDAYFEDKYHVNISNFFKSYGEEMFRKLENEVLIELLEKDNIVISTGGGLPCFNNNMDTIKKNGISLYLEMSPISILNRLQNSKKGRPLLKDKTPDEAFDYITSSLKEREVYYKQATITIRGESPNIKEIQKEVLSIR